MLCFSCGSEFDPRPSPTKRQKYCSIKCRPSYAPRKIVVIQNCLQCHAVLNNRLKSGRPKIYCGKKCQDKYHTELKRIKRQMSKNCKMCNKAFETGRKRGWYCSSKCREIATAHRLKLKHRETLRAKYPEGVAIAICGWCQKERQYDPIKGTPRAYHEKCRVEARRAYYRSKTVKRQNIRLQPIRVAADQIVAIHGWICYLCKKPIDPEVPRTSKQGLSVDHIVPISRGGLDELDNLRPAHWICNNRKSDKLLEEIDAESW